jgi:hypothetical protein
MILTGKPQDSERNILVLLCPPQTLHGETLKCIWTFEDIFCTAQSTGSVPVIKTTLFELHKELVSIFYTKRFFLKVTNLKITA